MNKKPLFSAIFTVLVLSIFFGYSLVFGAGGNYNGPTKRIYSTGNSIYTGDLVLNKTKLVFRSSYDLSDFIIESTCDTHTKLIGEKKSIYIFEVKYFGSCGDEQIIFRNTQNEVIYTGVLNIYNEEDVFSKMIDYKTEDLKKLKVHLATKNRKNYRPKTSLDKNKSERLQTERIYLQKTISKILEYRNEKYLSPVEGYTIPKVHSKIPNAGRPYRESYTDGIHHGWDVGSQLGENVRALDEGIIIRVISDFVYEDLDKLNKSAYLSDDDKIKNLDILRGNQVWLKTSRGDVVFYSHLQDVYSHIEEGQMIRKGDPIGTIGISGVPDKNYTDYHLHFAVQSNPYDKQKAGTYDFEDYMKWDWKFRGKSAHYIFEEQDNLFE
ncbi:MAG: peptidoglycan DD-metalloendopeptidase family protein [Candidatus Gracilibacteria bacterium]|nr:peptidoglycan DD-metalloendopeptidase family protein [Candidatus Gracilibacteria bacterium]